jgi:tetratricopeptide (TPR) repeat protein
MAPDRALPHVGLAGVLVNLDRIDDALAAYRAALERAPDDEGALRGQGDLLVAQGRRAEAAGAYDRLAGVLDRAGRLADACDVARRALELAESRGRRRMVQGLVDRLRANAQDDAVAETLARALSVLEAERVGTGSDEVDGAPGEASTAAAGAGSGSPGEAPVPPPVILPPPDPAPLRLAFEQAIDEGNLDEARRQAVATSVAHRLAGQFHASIDACYEALDFAPADPGVHFALAQAYLERGWHALAADKLVLIGRLALLTGDTATQARLCDLARRRFPDDARLAEMCA